MIGLNYYSSVLLARLGPNLGYHSQRLGLRGLKTFFLRNQLTNILDFEGHI